MTNICLVFRFLFLVVFYSSLALGAVYDFDGDGKTDPVVIRGEGNQLIWYILNSSLGFSAVSWGANVSEFEDRQIPADYDGDGKTDVAIWRRPLSPLAKTPLTVPAPSCSFSSPLPSPHLKP